VYAWRKLKIVFFGIFERFLAIFGNFGQSGKTGELPGRTATYK